MKLSVLEHSLDTAEAVSAVSDCNDDESFPWSEVSFWLCSCVRACVRAADGLYNSKRGPSKFTTTSAKRPLKCVVFRKAI